MARSLSWGERVYELGIELLGDGGAGHPNAGGTHNFFTRPGVVAGLCRKGHGTLAHRTVPSSSRSGPPAACEAVRACMQTLNHGLRCLRSELDFYNVTLLVHSARVPRWVLRAGREAKDVALSQSRPGNSSRMDMHTLTRAFQMHAAAYLNHHFPPRKGGVDGGTPRHPELYWRSRTGYLR